MDANIDNIINDHERINHLSRVAIEYTNKYLCTNRINMFDKANETVRQKY